MGLFSELIEYGCCEYNPVRDIMSSFSTCQNLDWLDVEQTYYDELLLCKSPKVYSTYDIKILNEDFEKVKSLLEKSLIRVEDEAIINSKITSSIKSILREDFIFKDFSEYGLRKFSNELLEKIQPYLSPYSQNDPSYLSKFERMIVSNSADDSLLKILFLNILGGIKDTIGKIITSYFSKF